MVDKGLTECIETAVENKIETLFCKTKPFFLLIGKTKTLKLLWRGENGSDDKTEVSD